MLAEDAGDGVVAARQRKLVFQSLGAEGGLFPELDGLACETGGRLMRAVLGPPAQFLQGGGLARNVASEPFTDGVAGTSELARRRLQTVGASEGNELMMQPMTIGAYPVKFNIGAIHAGRMANLARRC